MQEGERKLDNQRMFTNMKKFINNTIYKNNQHHLVDGNALPLGIEIGWRSRAKMQDGRQQQIFKTFRIAQRWRPKSNLINLRNIAKNQQ